MSDPREPMMFLPSTLALTSLALPFGPPATELTAHVLLTLGLSGLLAWLFRGADHAVAELQECAVVDPLTGLGNRRAFEMALDEAWASCREGLVVVRFDLSGPRKVGDLRGDGGRDELPRALADALRARLEPGATAFRVGIDEYAVLCGASSPAAAEAALRTALAQVRQAGILEPSVGSAAATEASSSGTLIDLAEERLFPWQRAESQDSSEVGT